MKSYFTDIRQAVYLEDIGYCHIGIQGDFLALYPSASNEIEDEPVSLTYRDEDGSESVYILGATIGVINSLLDMWYQQQ